MNKNDYEAGQQLPFDIDNVLEVETHLGDDRCARCHYKDPSKCGKHYEFCGADKILKLKPIGGEAIDISRTKYNVEYKGITLDVYDVLKAFDVRCPALQHLIKKALKAGGRGHKDLTTDLDDIIASAIRAKELAK